MKPETLAELLEQVAEKVRKETAREILEPLREVVMKHSDCCVNLSEDIKFLWRKYGLEIKQ